jgi:hypothetical protein
MPAFGVTVKGQAGLGGQDTTQQLQRLFTGRTIGAAPFGYAGVTGVVQSSTSSTCEVAIDNFDSSGQSTFTCNYQPQGSDTPPSGTPCLIAFPANGDHTPWVTAFSGWPS